MTDRFQSKSLFTADWWKNNTALWYIMNIVTAAIGLYIYKMTMLDNITSGPWAGAGVLLLFILFILSLSAAHAHVQKRKEQKTSVEVNIGTTATLCVLAILLTLGGAIFQAYPVLVALGFMASAVTLTLTIKNLIVQYMVETRR